MTEFTPKRLIRLAPILIPLLLSGCSKQEPIMAADERWLTVDELRGWTICPDFDEAVKQAHLARHPKHQSYIPISEVRPLSASESESYDRLNQKLHDELRRLSHEHFDNTPVPEAIQEKRGDETYFTPFTYQNYDWYGPSYECYIGVLTDYISAALLRRIQSVLQGEHQDWCIRVVSSAGPNFDTQYEIAVFSDQVIVPANAARAMCVPSSHQQFRGRE